uniref:Uncharacterized protein TCIL3000_3_3420 n=1 Tax=Trypanosoma congolense (strain IL3000) TaxID=1068625 RepID=G0UKK2_TRYCI|nr:unnamed protein product [Trypanosoma congolense IL3000]
MPARKRVMWDEKNLEDNEEYRRAHPVTMHITEPKTPFEYGREYEEDFEDAMDRNSDVDTSASTSWDPEVNKLARQVREEFRKEAAEVIAPVSSTGRPMLSLEVVTGEALEKQREAEFKIMRKAVYADEGRRVKALLGKCNFDDEEEEENDAQGDKVHGEQGE